MTFRLLVTGSPGFANEFLVSSMFESDFRLAAGQVIEIHDRTEGVLHDIVAELIADHADKGLTREETPGPLSNAMASLVHPDAPSAEFLAAQSAGVPSDLLRI